MTSECEREPLSASVRGAAIAPFSFLRVYGSEDRTDGDYGYFGSVGDRFTWQDDENGMLESRLGEIAVQLVLTAEIRGLLGLGLFDFVA